MARGLDQLIDWLVAETAYCGETGFRVADFVTAVSRFNGRSQPKSEVVDGDGNSINNGNGGAPTADTDVFVDMPLARKAWEWLVERPEILVGRSGDRGHLSLDDALALPEPQPPVPVEAADDDAEDQKIDMAATSLTVSARDGKRKPSRGPKSMADVAAAAAAAAANDDPNMRPRLYATEKTIWYTLTGHDVDYKKVPMLEWQCLQGIASARTKGILQADLRELVDQDKRSVPKRTDFLAAKGYAVKRTTIARGYRTSMLWLTEFAPIELDAGAAEPVPEGDSQDPTPSLLSSKDLASNGIDFSPEFLTKDLEPVPWRNRWIGDAIEFASFGQTILAIVKAWGVIRVVDLKLKLGIMGLRWQMRTLARASREFVASGILRFVAAMRADERQLFKDCIKYERDPTPGEWAVYLAAGRRRAPITELRAKRKKEQGRLQYGGGAGDNQSELDMAALEEEDEDELGAAGSLLGTNGGAARKPAWALDVPLANLIYDTVDRAGIDGITSPEICRATLGGSFARYIFSLVTAMSRPGSQPDHLIKFQLHCEPSRVGKNKAYLFRTLENAKLAERLSNGESIETIEQEAADAAAEGSTDAKKFWDLYDTGKLFDLPAEELRRLYGFAPLPPPMTAEELEAQEVKFTTPHVRKKTGRPRKGTRKDKGAEGDGSGGVDADGIAIEIVDAGTPPPKRKRGRPPKVKEVEVEVVDTEMVDAEGNANNGDGNDVEVIAAPAVPKRRGRPPKAKPADTEAKGAEDKEVEAVQPKPSPPKRRRGRPPKKKSIRQGKTPAESDEDDTPVADGEEPQAAPEEDENAEPLPTVRLGEPGSLSPKTGERRGRRRRSIVVIFRLEQLRDRDFLANQQGYKEGAIRIEPGENDEDEEAEADERGRSDPEDDEENEQIEQDDQDGQARSVAAFAEIKLIAADLEPVASHYNGKLGHLTVDLDSKTLKFTYTVPRRGRRPAHQKEPITIATDNLVGDPVIRRAPGGDGQAFVLEARETSEGKTDREAGKDANGDNEHESTPQEGTADATWPFVFILDDDADDNEKHAATLRDVLVAVRAQSQRQEQGGGDAAPARRLGRLPGKKNKNPGKLAEEGPREFICETCSGVWKNLLGLQYHQTKARTTCNPTYVPISAEEKEAKKKQQREEREQERQQPGQMEIAEGRGGRALRQRKQPVGAFREASPVSLASTRSHSPSPSVASASLASSLSQKKEGRQPLKVHGNRRRPYRLQDSESSEGERADRPRGIVGAAMVWLDSREGSPSQPDDVEVDAGPSNVPNIPVAQPDVEDSPMEDAGEVDEEPAAKRQKSDSPVPAEETSQQQPSTRVEPSRETLVRTEAIATPLSSAAPPRTPSAATTPAQSAIDTPNKAGPAGFRMPPLPKNGTKLSPFSLRSYIVMEITKYLVDYFGGIFPGDRSLWYAAFRIYTRTFPGEDPPTLTVIKAAVKKLEMAKEVEEHTFGFRDPRGQFIYCRLLARPGTELFTSATASDFKKRIQAAFPQPYVPADFTPSEKDMAILRILDKDSGRNSRGRRQLQPEIEVLKAPFYEQPQTARSAANTVLLVGYGEEEDGDTYQQRTPNGKRKATLTAGDLIGGSSTEHTPKRRRARYAGPAAENSLLRALGSYYGGEGVEMYDNEADIDPALRTVKTQATTGNPGLDSLPASFFLSEDDLHWNRSKTKPAKLRADGADGFTTFVYFLPPNTLLEDGQDEEESIDYDAAGKHMPGPREDRPPPRAYKIVTKTQVLYDLRKKSPGAWPVVTETIFQRHSDASFTMDGFMPTRKALVRANLPRTAAECASMLRANHKFSEFNDTPEGAFHRDLEYCRSWEMSQSGTDLLRNPSVAPRYVFLNLAFPGAHYTAEDAEAQGAGKWGADRYAHPTLRWLPKNLYTVNTIPYGMLDGDDNTLNNLAPTTPAQRKKWARSSSELAALREKQAQQAKYVMSSRREQTAYPQKPADYVHHLTASASAAGGMDWTANDTLVAAFVVVRTLLGGLGQTIDWGLMMRLFPDKRLSALRNFWKNTRRERQLHVDKFTERFQQAFIEAYERQELPPIDYENILAYDWGWLVGWALRLMRHGTNALPATREALEQSHRLGDLPQSRIAGWREDFFHISRSVWNRLHDTASEPAAMAIDKLLPVTPTEAAAEGAVDELRHMVARSWIRALCGTPHARYQPSRIKRKLLTLGSLGSSSTDSDNNVGVLDETTTNNLLQTVIGNLTTDRILRRTKSMIALGGRMYTLTEAYENVLEKAAMEDKFRQAFAFKADLDTCFRRGKGSEYEIPVDTNDDGMIMALMNLQAHGRVIVEAMDAPHIPFGFEPGNYESRKFPKHYQRFRTRIVPTDKYVYNDHVDLDAMLQHVAASVATDGGANAETADSVAGVLPPPPRMGPNEEMPIWRDFFGILDRTWFARLAGAVVFLLATRGATPIRQTAAHLRPIIEPFEVQMLMEWATDMGILEGDSGNTNVVTAMDMVDHPPNSRTVSEWWWLLLGQVYAASDVSVTDENGSKQLNNVGEKTEDTTLADIAEEVEYDEEEGEDEDE